MENDQWVLIPLGGLLVIAVLSTCFLSRFADRDVTWFSFLTSVTGVTTALSIIAVMPLDIWEALVSEAQHDHKPTPSSTLRSGWAVIYWSTCFLCYLLFPLLMNYESAGDFTTGGRLRASVCRSACIYIIYAIIGCTIIVWALTHSQIHGTLQAWCIAAANAWGLLVLTVLMGYGLVAVPRHLWHSANPGKQLQSLYVTVAVQDEARLTSLFDLEEVIADSRAELAAWNAGSEDQGMSSDAELQHAFSTLQRTLAKCEETYSRVSPHGRQNRIRAGNALVSHQRREGTAASTSASAHLINLAQLHQTMKAAELEARRATCQWASLVRKCLYFENLESEQFKAAAELIVIRPCGALAKGCCPRTRHSVGICLHRILALCLRSQRARMLRTLSVVCGCLSTVIVLGQLTMFADRWSFSLLSFMFTGNHGPVITLGLCIVPLSYMTCTTYFSIFHMKIAGWYGLYGDHNTDTGSLLWCASMLVKLSPPLCYHFLLLIHMKGTTFQSFMGQMNIVPVFGNSFNQVFPCIIFVLCILNLLNAYSKIMQCLSFGLVGFEFAASSNTEDPVAEGKQLIDRERRRQAQEFVTELPKRIQPEKLEMPFAAGG